MANHKIVTWAKRFRWGVVVAVLLYEGIITFLALGYLMFFGLGLSLFSLLLLPFFNYSGIQRFGRHTLQILLKIFFFGLNVTRLLQVDARALDKLRGQKSIIIIANHPCLMDALFFSSRLPDVASVMKAAVLKNPVFFGGATLAGFIRSDSPRNFVKHCCDVLANDSQLLFFPEGTRSKTRAVNTFKGGFAMVAKESGRPVQTVFVEANTAFLGKGWQLWKRPAFPLKYRLVLGESFQMDNRADHKKFTLAMENYFKNNIPDYQYSHVTDSAEASVVPVTQTRK